MADFASSQSGNWNDTATWGGSGPPGNGDTCQILGHTVTVTADVTIGLSSAGGNYAIALNHASANLVINNGVTVTCRGDVWKLFSGAKVTMNAGSKFKFDATAAASPSTSRYIAHPSAHSLTGPIFDVNGTVGSRCEISSVAGGAPGYFTHDGFVAAGLIDAEFCDFIRIGEAGVSNSFLFGMNGNGQTFRCVDCTFDTCNTIYSAYNMADTDHFILERCKFTNSLDTYNIYIQCTNDALTTGTRRIIDCALDLAVQIVSQRDWTITGNFFNLGIVVSTSASVWAEFSDNLVRNAGQAGTNLGGSITDCYYLEDHSDTNPHGVQPCRGTLGSMTIDGMIYEYTGTDQNGDCILIGDDPSGACVATIRNCIFLPNASGGCSGSAFSALGHANVNIIFEHNTACAGQQGAAVGEGYIGHTGMLQSFKNNIFWNNSTNGLKLYDVGTDDSVTDLVTAANADYNCGHNIGAGDGGGYFNLEFSSGSPGANDIDVDPQFVEPTRDIASWDRSLGGSGTTAGALARLAADPTLTRTSLIPYIRAGFAPQNPLLRGAGSDHSTIGAVEYSQPVEVVWCFN